MDKKINKKLITIGAVFFAAITGLIVKAGLKKNLNIFNKKEPPEPEKTTWKKTIFWTVLSGLLSSFSKLLVQKTAKKAG
ncbi:MAG: DUF4235 domain-containing protein [Fibrobacter sp.]|nr:DUF4235 domain-containing protein [Fibrobacter sp.]